MTDPLVITIPAAAARLSMSEEWVKREIRAGRLKSVKYGRARRIRVADLTAFVAARDDSRVTSIGTARRRRRQYAPLPETDVPMPLPEFADVRQDAGGGRP